MPKKYPNIDRHKKANKKARRGSGKSCVGCGEKTTGKIEIQVSYMRGDDEFEPCCNDCWKNRGEADLLDLVMLKWQAA